MGRRARSYDPLLAVKLREFMARERKSQNELAILLGLDKATVSRSMSSQSFSTKFQRKAEAMLRLSGKGNESSDLVLKLLRISAECSTLLGSAQTLLAQALDLAEQRS